MATPKKKTATPKPATEQAETQPTGKPDFSRFAKRKAYNEFADNKMFQEQVKTVPYWIDTGCYALNIALSGDAHKGIPGGRVIVLAGESRSGKSLLAQFSFAKPMNANGRYIWYVDSENASTEESLIGNGLIEGGFKLIPENSPERLTTSLMKILDDDIATIKANPKEPLRSGIVIDSLSMLSSQKEGKIYSDAPKDDVYKGDMGNNAKSYAVLFRQITMKAAMAQATVVCTNHLKKAVDAYGGSYMTGGAGSMFAGSLVVWLRRESVKDKTTGVIKGNIFHAKMEKSRFTKAGIVSRFYMDFQKGLNKWYGLHILAVDAGLMVEYSKDAAEKLGVTATGKGNSKHWIIKDPKKKPADWLVVPEVALHTKDAIGTILEEINEWAKENIVLKGLATFGADDDGANDFENAAVLKDDGEIEEDMDG